MEPFRTASVSDRMMATKHRTGRFDRLRRVGEFVPPRKLLKKAGDIEMWQVEVPAPGGRNLPIVQYEVCGADARKAIFSRPHLALEHFEQLSKAIGPADVN